MAKALVFAAVLMATGSAGAQPPQAVEPEGQIEMAVGEARTFTFGEAFQSATTVAKDIAEIIPQSDHTLTISGLKVGQTFLYVQDSKGQMVYTATLSVTPSAGHLVKFYGTRPRSEHAKDFVGYYCGETGCGRADMDKTDDPTVYSTTVTRPASDGSTESVTRQYGR